MKHSVRNWHTWVSLALGLPLLLVGLTTFFIAHNQALGTKDILIPVGWLGEAVKEARVPEVRATLRRGEELWLGTSQGVLRVVGARALPLEGGPQDEIRDLAAAGDAVLMAGRRALWRYADGAAQKLRSGDCWHIAADGDGYAAACKEVGLLASADGVRWETRAIEFAVAPEARLQGVPLSRVVMDIHTGKLFFGKRGEWIWIDLLGLCTVGLGLTGFIMWTRGRRVRAQAARC